AVACTLNEVILGAFLYHLQGERLTGGGTEYNYRDTGSLRSGPDECFQSIAVREAGIEKNHVHVTLSQAFEAGRQRIRPVQDKRDFSAGSEPGLDQFGVFSTVFN